MFKRISGVQGSINKAGQWQINFNVVKAMASAVIASTLDWWFRLADEIGISVDAPTLFTGEDIMVRFAYNMLLCELT
jgi:hypothetical protein